MTIENSNTEISSDKRLSLSCLGIRPTEDVQEIIFQADILAGCVKAHLNGFAIRAGTGAAEEVESGELWGAFYLAEQLHAHIEEAGDTLAKLRKNKSEESDCNTNTP